MSSAIKSYLECVHYLESLQMMPKTMPGLEKIRRAYKMMNLQQYMNPQKVIVVAGTNGKGSTCATLESLLLSAGKRVGFYSSPHLVSTTERIRMNGQKISEKLFLQLFHECEEVIKKAELSHFEALTLMMSVYFFHPSHLLNLDYVILEVGLGGLYDATNAVPHATCVITPIDFDHVAILGPTLKDIALNKLGIIPYQEPVLYPTENRSGVLVIYQKPVDELQIVYKEYFAKNPLYKENKLKIVEVKEAHHLFVQKKKTNDLVNDFKTEMISILQSPWGEAELSLLGERGAQNAMTALTVFENLGFDPSQHLQALSQVNWGGRMQKIEWPVKNNIATSQTVPVYLSGDHNPQGIQSLLKILKGFSWNKLHLIFGAGIDKDEQEMMKELLGLSSVQLYLTETPFKGRKLAEYSVSTQERAFFKSADGLECVQNAIAEYQKGDLILVTGSLYLVGTLLAAHENKNF